MWRLLFATRVCRVVRDEAAFVRAFGSGELDGPTGVCVDGDNNIVLADSNHHRIVVARLRDGALVRTFGSHGSAPGQFEKPDAVCVNSAGHIIVADTNNHRVQIFTCDGTFVRAFGSEGDGDGQFGLPESVCVDGDDNIFVADPRNHRIQMFTSDGTFLRAFGEPIGPSWGGYDDPGELRLKCPSGVCVNSSGNLIIVADEGNCCIQQFRADGSFVRAFGSEGSGPAQFQACDAVCVDGADNIFVTDTYNHRIQQFRSDGTFVRAFGSFGSGPAQFYSPWGVCVGADGALFVADYNNCRIQEYR